MDSDRDVRRPAWRAAGALLAVLVLAGAAVGIVSLIRSGGSASAQARVRVVSPFGLGNAEGAMIAGMSEHEAANAVTTGVVVGPDYRGSALASQAPGRTVVQLRRPGQYVQFRLTEPANALDVSFALRPGTSASLAVYVNGARLRAGLPVSSPVRNVSAPGVPGSRTPQLFSDARLLLKRQLAAGDIVRLQAGPGAATDPCSIALADFYQVPAPASQPPHSVSVVTEGADPTGARDSAAAFRKAIAVASAAGEPVWIPAGTYVVATPLQVKKATIMGAGEWYAQIEAGSFIDNTTSVTGPVNLSGFAIVGPSAGAGGSAGPAIGGSLGTDSVVDGLWIQDTAAGLQLQGSNSYVTVQNCEILGTQGDGIDIGGPASGSLVKNNLIRNTGGDGVAIWSDSAATVSDNTVVMPVLGNGIAEYGGSDNTIVDNVVADTHELGSGIAISNQESGQQGLVPLAGTITVVDDTVLRSGSLDSQAGQPMGAVRIGSGNYPVSHVAIDVSDDTIEDSPYSAIEIAAGSGRGLPVTGVTFDDDTIDRTGTVVVQADTSGSAAFSLITAAHIGVAGSYQPAGQAGSDGFTASLGTGNTGWSTKPVLAADPTGPGSGAKPSSKPSSGPSRDPGRGSTPPPALAASATSAAQGATVTFRYSTPRLHSQAWVGVDPKGQAPGRVVAPCFSAAPLLRGSVTCSTAMLDGPGSYDVYYGYGEGASYRELAAPVRLTVTGARSTLTASAASVRSGAQVTFRYATTKMLAQPDNWIGIFPFGQTVARGDDWLAYRFAPAAHGSVTFRTTGLKPGTYWAYYNFKDGYRVLTGPVTLTVTGK
jgi:Pectate lyase superfamily protein